MLFQAVHFFSSKIQDSTHFPNAIAVGNLLYFFKKVNVHSIVEKDHGSGFGSTF
jgi:hypothetical protein